MSAGHFLVSVGPYGGLSTAGLINKMPAGSQGCGLGAGEEGACLEVQEAGSPSCAPLTAPPAAVSFLRCCYFSLLVPLLLPGVLGRCLMFLLMFSCLLLTLRISPSPLVAC